MPLINCKVELKLRWTKHSVLAAAGNDNTNDNPTNFIFTFKDKTLYVPAKFNEHKMNIYNYKTKRENKNTADLYRYLNQILLEFISYLF